MKQISKEERKVDWIKIIAAFALSCLIFIAGIALGTLITKDKVESIVTLEKEARLELETLSLEEKLFEQNPCIDPSHLSKKLDDLGTKLTYLESQYSKNSKEIMDLKKPYTLLELRHYFALKNMIEKCNYNYTLILFFYSNSPENIKISEEQGFVLDYLKKKFGNVKIYSFDSDLDLDIIKLMKEMYGLTIIPSIVINDKVYAGFHSKEELEKLLEINSKI
ncbi:MAG: hypothetical protein QW041_02045 [Candidatus Pacearchaeota archaeon]